MFKKGSVLLRNSSANNLEKTSSKNTKQIAVLHVDIIGDPFWDERPSLLK